MSNCKPVEQQLKAAVVTAGRISMVWKLVF